MTEAISVISGAKVYPEERRTLMGAKKIALVERLRRQNDQFFIWEERHNKLEREIRNLNKKHLLTPEEEVLRKNLQKEKLLAKDKMTEILKSEDRKEKAKKAKEVKK